VRFNDLLLILKGSTSGEQIIKTAAAASGAITLPAGTTDFSGTSGVVQQATTGAPFTAGTVAVANGGTGLTTGTSGGIPYYSAAGTMASSAALTTNALIKGAGAGAAPVASNATIDGSGNMAVTGALTVSGNTGLQNVYIAGANTLYMNGVALAGNDALNAGYNKLYDNSQTPSIYLGNGVGTSFNVYQQVGHLFNNRSGTLLARFQDAGAYKPGGGVWLDSSDIRLKRNITPYETGLAQVTALNPVRFQFNGKGTNPDDGRVFTGLIADDVAEIMPEMVGTLREKLDPEDEDETELLTLDATSLIYALVNAVKELSARVEALEAGSAATG
jgi:hypothetical protein